MSSYIMIINDEDDEHSGTRAENYSLETQSPNTIRYIQPSNTAVMDKLRYSFSTDHVFVQRDSFSLFCRRTIALTLSLPTPHSTSDELGFVVTGTALHSGMTQTEECAAWGYFQSYDYDYCSKTRRGSSSADTLMRLQTPSRHSLQ